MREIIADPTTSMDEHGTIVELMVIHITEVIPDYSSCLRVSLFLYSIKCGLRSYPYGLCKLHSGCGVGPALT